MSQMIKDIKKAKQDFGFNLKEAYEYVKGLRAARSAIESRRHKNQQRLEDIWTKIKYPYGRPHETKPITGTANYGQHIRIYCRKCRTTGTTKNIAPLGCRTLFIKCDCDSLDNIITMAPVLTASDFEAQI